ncbi:MAG: bacterial Ig-like domain-containing protein, partial [Alkalibacterium sp.]|nr:bacterial Ig-like domain-containing protein [Alkalibacterium sp.]
AVTIKDNDEITIEIGLSTDPTYAEQSFTYYSLKNSNQWDRTAISLEELTQKTVYAVKLRLTAEQAVSNYKLNLGELALYQKEETPPAPKQCEEMKKVLFNAQEAEAIVKVTPVKSAKQYEVYQKSADSWTFLNASSSNILYLSNLSRPKETEGTIQDLKVVAVGANGERSKPLFTCFDWQMETTDTTLPAKKAVNIMSEAEVTSYIDPTSTENPKNSLTGTINNTSDKWYSSKQSDSVSVRFDAPRKVVRWVVEHAGAGGESADSGLMNTRDFNLEYKDTHSGQWAVAVEKRENNEDITDVLLDEPVKAQEWRLNILTADNGSPWGGIRIYNWKMYESVNKESQNLPVATARAVHIKDQLFSVILSNGLSGSSVYLYSDKEAKNQLAEQIVDSNGLVVFHKVNLTKYAGLLYYRSCQPNSDLSHISAIHYNRSDIILEQVCLESSDSIQVNQAEQLNLDDQYANLHYSDGSNERISLSNLLVEVDAFDENQEGKQLLTVSFAGIHSNQPLLVTNQPIHFEEKDIQCLELSDAPKTSYLRGEALDLSKGSVKIRYTDGLDVTSPLLNAKLFKISGFNKDETGVQSLTVTHRSYSVTFDVVVKEESVNFQRLDQLIGKVEAAMEQKPNPLESDEEKERIAEFLKTASALKLADTVTQSEVDRVVADYSDVKK